MGYTPETHGKEILVTEGRDLFVDLKSVLGTEPGFSTWWCTKDPSLRCSLGVIVSSLSSAILIISYLHWLFLGPLLSTFYIVPGVAHPIDPFLISSWLIPVMTRTLFKCHLLLKPLPDCSYQLVDCGSSFTSLCSLLRSWVFQRAENVTHH